MDINKIEKALLDRELKIISCKLEKIGSKIADVFDKYGKIEGEHGQEIHEYIAKHVLKVTQKYYAGYTTRPEAWTDPKYIPECIKELVLNWAVKDFFDKIDEIESVVGNIE